MKSKRVNCTCFNLDTLSWLTCGKLFLDSEEKDWNVGPESGLFCVQILGYADYAFTSIFTVEILLKVNIAFSSMK